MARKQPFKGWPAFELLKFADECLSISEHEDDQISNIHDLTLFLLDMDPECPSTLAIVAPSGNPTGLQPAAMVEKMDMLLDRVLKRFAAPISEDFYLGMLEIFSNSVIKLHEPNYVQFITYYLACSSKERADGYLSLLLNVIHDKECDIIARRQAVTYVASFVCRAKLLSWTHSARTSKYLVSFMHTLNIDSSDDDRLLFLLCLQAICYIICWECSNWKPHIESPELDWLSRSKMGLLALLYKHKDSGLVRLVSFDILTMLYPLVGRISVQLKSLVSDAITTYRQLLPVTWRKYVGSEKLKPHFPFDPFHNLTKSVPFILPLCREWINHDKANDAMDGHNDQTDTDSDEEVNMESEHLMGHGDEVWNFHDITAALTGHKYRPSPVFGPVMDSDEIDDDLMLSSPVLTFSEGRNVDDIIIGPNLILNRILSSDKFASAPR